MIKTRIKKKMSLRLRMRLKRKLTIRSSGGTFGTAERPRLCVFKSNKFIYAQVIDDVNSNVMLASNSLQKSLKESGKNNRNVEAAKKVGEDIAKKLKTKGLEAIVFDRNGYPYKGKVKALGDAARAAGLKFQERAGRFNET